MKRVFTSESVTEGHPDKVCDRIADSVLDEILKQDRDARVACECAVKDNYMLIMGEITTSAQIDAEKIARELIANNYFAAIGHDVLGKLYYHRLDERCMDEFGAEMSLAPDA